MGIVITTKKEIAMSNQFEPRQNGPQQTSLDDDLRMLSETLEEVKSRLSGTANTYCAKARQVAEQTDTYVRDNPWHGVGAGAAVGLVIGLLLRR